MQKGMSKEIRTKFITNMIHSEDVDGQFFDEWKVELQKELPSFWESLNRH